MKKIHIAPMMGWTDQHFRYFMHLMCPGLALYSEMITSAAITHGSAEQLLRRDVDDGEVVLQLGGSDPQELAVCAQEAQRYGYSEVNLNVGCPSSRVQAGKIGACLYKEPERVAACVAAMVDAVDLPVSVKCRIGVDDVEGLEYLVGFINLLAANGCAKVQIHARKAWLKGLNPKQNRTIPPLDYDLVYAASQQVDLPVILNGGLVSYTAVMRELNRFPGVMIGRCAYMRPLAIRDFVMGADAVELRSIASVLAQYLDYVGSLQRKGYHSMRLLRPLQNVFYAQPHAKQWRISLNACVRGELSVRDLSAIMLGFCDKF